MKAISYILLSLPIFVFSCNHEELTQEPTANKNDETILSPLLLRVENRPQAFYGSDKKYHLEYELMLSNFSNLAITLDSIQIKNNQDKDIKTLSGSELLSKFKAFGEKATKSELNAGQSGILFIHLIFSDMTDIPPSLRHQVKGLMLKKDVSVPYEALGSQVEINRQQPIIIGAPLKGSGYLAADSCCDSVRHVRAALPINGTLKFAQRFAIDYEQIDSNNKLFTGNKEDLKNYNIFGQEALAVMDGIVESTVDGINESIPGTFPPGITAESADGNAVILKLAENVYALYAHLQPGSLKVKKGEFVKRGQLLGLVGNTGNSLAPHLHFHLMDSPSPLNSNGIPYLIDSFTLNGLGTTTENFDEAESKGIPINMSESGLTEPIYNAFPMDLSVVSFP